MIHRTQFALAVAALSVAAQAQNIGPSTSVSPYMLPTRYGVTTTSILTVNDPTSTINGYRMVGIPDGLGAFAGPGRSLTLLMNHELGNTNGIARSHGFAGAFVSRWEINADPTNLQVLAGRDHNVVPADVIWVSEPARAWNRFCSADMAAPTAYRFGALGTDARILLNGEESGNEGTGWAHIATGPGTNRSYELPALGRFSWENSVACPVAQAKTIVVGLDDSSPGQVYVYVGTKTSSGSDVDLAGLTNGVLYGVKVPGIPTETRPVVINSTFELAPLGSQIGVTGAALNTASNAAGVTNFLRPEDGCWDERTGHSNKFYFVTTDTVTSSGGRSRLYQLTFTDISRPELGGTISTLLQGTEGYEMLDNMCIDTLGRIILQEDVGGNARLGRQWLYDVPSASLTELTSANPAFFQTGSANFLTIDEEASGVIDAKNLLGDGWFLLDLQSHNNLGGELVQGGQLMAMWVDPTLSMPAGVETVGAGSPGCSGVPLVSAKVLPTPGAANFALGCVNAPTSAPGALALAANVVSPPIQVLGIDLWLDPNLVFLTIGVNSNGIGQVNVPLPIPASTQVGDTIYGQFIWVGPSAPPPCPPLGVSASNAVRVQLQ